MPRGLPVLATQGLLPALGAPAAGVGRVDGDDGDAELGSHGHEPCAQAGGGQAGDQLGEPLAAAVLLPGLVRGEVQVLDREGQTAPRRPVQQADQGVPHLRVPMLRAAGQPVVESAGRADGVAVLIRAPGGQVVGVHVHPDQPTRTSRFQRHRPDLRDLPGGGHVPAVPVRVVVDAVGHRTMGGDAVGPLFFPVAEDDPAGEHVPAAGRVGQPGQRRREFDAHLTAWCDADRLVAVPLAGLAIGLEKPAFGLPQQFKPRPDRTTGREGGGQACA